MFGKIFSSVVLALSVAGTAYGHGENMPGPNNGFIRMPGAYHTEVVPHEKGLVRVYLLDVHFKELQADDANIEASMLKGVTKLDAECKRSADYFECQFPPQVSFDHGTLHLKISLGTYPDGFAIYPLPLQRA